MELNDRAQLIDEFLPLNGSYMEIGVWTGDLASQVMLLSHPLVMALIDPWKISVVNRKAWYGSDIVTQEEMDEIYLSVCERFVHDHGVCIFRDTSRRILENHMNVYDVIYIDGDHTFPCVYDDILFSRPLLTSSGVIICDDYRSDKWFGSDVIDAVDHFVAHSNMKLEIRDDQAILTQ